MTKLDRYLIQRLTATFFKTCFSLLTLFILMDLLTHQRSNILEKDVPTDIVLEYYIRYIPIILNNYQIAPLSLLIAGLLVFGTFVQRSEYTAMLASGIGLKRMLLAPLLVSLLIGLSMVFINENIGPDSAKRIHEIKSHYFGYIRSGGRSNRNGVFWAKLGNDGWKCDIQKFNRQAMTGEHVFLYAHHPDHHEQIEARRIFWDESTKSWILEDGTWKVYDPQQQMTGQVRRITQTPAPFTETPDYLFAAEIDTRTQSITQLSTLMKKHQFPDHTQRRMTLDIHTKLVNPLLCILFMSLSIPFSIRLGRGNISIGLSVAILLGMGYLLISGVAQSIGYSGQLPPALAAWLPFTAYFFLCSTLISRTAT